MAKYQVIAFIVLGTAILIPFPATTGGQRPELPEKSKGNQNKLLQDLLEKNQNKAIRDLFEKIRENQRIPPKESDSDKPPPSEATRRRDSLPSWFKDLDANADGQISVKEWQKAGKSLDEFAFYDRNDDGLITADEVLGKLNQQLNLKLKNGQASYNGTLVERPEEKYRGKKSYQILTVTLEAGKTYQIDHQSKVFQGYLYLEDDEGELLANHSSSTIGANSRIVFRAEQTGTYRIIATSLGGFRTGAFSLSVGVVNRFNGTLPSWFNDLDENKDGQISFREWQKAGKDPDAFAAYDRNEDGFITSDEVLHHLNKQLALKLEKGQASYSGTLVPTAEESYRGKKCYQILTVTLEAGKTYQIDHKSTAFDAFLILEDDEGELLDQDDDSGGNLNSRIVFRPDQTGTYRLIATSLGSGTGAFTLSVRVENRISGILSKDLPSWFNDLDKNADGQVSLQEWQKGGKDLDEFATYDRNDDGYITADEVLRFLKKLFDLKLENGQASYSGTLVETPEEKFRSKKSYQILTIALEAGKTYQIDHKSKVFQAHLYLVDDEGNVLEKHSARNVGENSRIVFQAEETGTYRIVATSAGGFRTGPFSLSVRVVNRFNGTLLKDLPSWFKDLDENGDGQVSLQEWQKGGKDLDEFARYDRNDDCFITAEEVLRCVKK